jgi:hypothetical protein
MGFPWNILIYGNIPVEDPRHRIASQVFQAGLAYQEVVALLPRRLRAEPPTPFLRPYLSLTRNRGTLGVVGHYPQVVLHQGVIQGAVKLDHQGLHRTG